MADRNGRRPARPPKKRRPRKPAGSGTPAGKAPPQSFALIVRPLATRHADAQKQRALDAFLKHGTVAAACSAARIGRTTWYDWRTNDPEFNRLAGEAEEAVTDALEEVAQLRATMPEGSDTLLIFLLKARRRALYGDKNQLTVISPEVQVRVQSTLQLIATKPTWDSEELINALSEIWK